MDASKSIAKYSGTSLKQLQFAEKMINSGMNPLMLIKCDGFNLFLNEINNKRKEEFAYLQSQRSAIKQSLAQLQDNVSSPDRIKTIDLVSYKRHVYEIYNNITNFKDYIEKSLSMIVKDQIASEEEMKYFDGICNQYSSDDFYNTLNTHSIPAKIVESRSNVPEDVKRFREFVDKNGGEYGGWGEQEHKLFMRYWYKHKINMIGNFFEGSRKNEKEFINDIQSIIPGIAEREILNHIVWMQKYNYLKDHKIEAINKWRNEKNKNILVKYSQNDMFENSRRTKNFNKISDGTLNKWKMEKIIQKKKEAEKNANDAIIKKEMEWKRQNDRRKEKDIITQWVEKKKLEEINSQQLLVEKSQNEQRNRSYNANKQIKQFQHRDQVKMNALKERQNNKASNSSVNINLLLKNVCSFQYRKRNYAAYTEQWNHRITKKEGLPPFQPNENTLENIPKLKIPHWRQGLVTR